MIGFFTIAVFIIAFSIATLISHFLTKLKLRLKPDVPLIPGFFHHFWKNLAKIFVGWNIVYLLSATALTVFMIFSGLDVMLQNFFQEVNPFGQFFCFFILIIGNFWHLALTLMIFFIGKVRRSNKLVIAGIAGFQALASSFFVTTMLKTLTGRKLPLRPGSGKHYFPRSDDPADFNFAFWQNSFQEGRVFYPSGHTASLIAFVTALVVYYSGNKWIVIIGYAFVIFTGLVMIDGDFHWSSDVVAGALIGHIIGLTVGAHFRRKYDDITSDSINCKGVTQE